MATTKFKDLREKPLDQIQGMLKERMRHLFDLRSQSVTEKLEDPSQMGKTRREIARLLTTLRIRELAETKTDQTSEKGAAEKPAAKGKSAAPEAAAAEVGTESVKKAVKKSGAKRAAKKTVSKAEGPEKTAE
jgi:large subunit ribosomal protein L29